MSSFRQAFSCCLQKQYSRRFRYKIQLTFMLCVALFALLNIVFFMLLGITSSEQAYLHMTPITCDYPTPETDELWTNVLSRGTIVQCNFFKPEGSAISEKHVLILSYEGKLYKALAKLIQDSSKVSIVQNVVDTHDRPAPIFRRSDRDFQAIPEIICYHMDRVLEIYRKPVILSRVLTNKILYKNFAQFPEWSFGRLFRAIEYRMNYRKAEYNVYVSLQPWMDGLENRPPPVEIRDYLTLTSHKAPHFSKEHLSIISDTLVYDFLVDEHDKKAEKNWVTSKNGTTLLWDNGLAFDHGPFADISCLDILCGTNEWRRGKQDNCDRICRFSWSMYHKLQYLYEQNISLGNLLEERMKQDLLFPLFHFARYEHFKDDPNTVSFKVSNFWEGLDEKLERIMNHIAGCMNQYSRTEVLIR